MLEPKKSTDRRILTWGITWAITYIICLFVVKELEPTKGFGIIFSFLPPLVFVIFIYNFIRGIALMDEVERRIQLEASVLGFALGLLLIMALSLLDFVITLNREDWGYRHLIPFFIIFYLIGVFIAKRKYNFDDEKHD